MHIGKTKQKFKCSPVYPYSWKSEKRENKSTGKIYFNENYTGKSQISNVAEVKYLGNKLIADASNYKDIFMKYNRGVGTTNKTQNILEIMYFSQYYFEVGLTLIESTILD